ncbi:actin-related protein 4 isoform X1 [Iris pallida]|uniref:Actin-related protein 4 isoform X1 n=1 Tax=Iris pallida TaxID=29817 RepID=A0AAX6GCQ0_IRIPA|nr:actin-related protein 4 isoform X1 [Iris pallida]
MLGLRDFIYSQIQFYSSPPPNLFLARFIPHPFFFLVEDQRFFSRILSSPSSNRNDAISGLCSSVSSDQRSPSSFLVKDRKLPKSPSTSPAGVHQSLFS